MSRKKIVAAVAVLTALTFVVVASRYKPATEGQVLAPSAPEDSFLVRPYSPTLGPKNAPVSIVEFFDPSCEACRAFHPIVKQIRKEFPNMVKVVVRYTTFHKGSEEAARILETARLQGNFEPVLEALLESQPNWARHGAPDLRLAWKMAGAAGLDVERARSEMLMPDITAILNQDMADVQRAGVKKTPTFFVNGKPLPSFGAQQLYDLVRSEVARARQKLDK